MLKRFWFYLKRKINRTHLEVFIIFLLLLTPLLWLKGGEVVLGPEEAIHAFENLGIEYLALENYLVSK